MPTATRIPSLDSTLRPLAPRDFDYWKAHHLLLRGGFGGTPERVRALATMGLDDAVDHLVRYREVPADRVTADTFDPDIMRPATAAERQAAQRARRSGNEAAVEAMRRERQRRQRADRRQMRAFQRWWLERLIATDRPLEEKMTLFWHGHFATAYRTIEDSYHMFQQNQLFRRFAVGNFKQLVHAIIHDPAMLRYLNNNRNIRRRPNENLARELMELFTLGEGNGYTEDDIKQGARALTGYGYRDNAFEFRSELHDDGSKRIFNRIGPWDGDDFVDIIFTQNYVSEYICLKLYRLFVHDLPDGPGQPVQAFLRRLAREFRQSNYDVKTILRMLFRSRHFYHPTNVAAQIKSPIQLVVQAIRGLGTPTRDLDTILEASALMGQNIGHPPSVKGWDGGRAWINTATLFVRHNLVLYLMTGRHPELSPRRTTGDRYDADHLIAHLRGADGRIDSEEAIIYLLRFMLGGEPHPDRVELLRSFVNARGGRLEGPLLTGALALIATMPEFQLC